MADGEKISREMPLVLIESPFAGDADINIRFARACLRGALRRGEAPLASHLLFTQEGILDDDIHEERSWGIEAGLAWGRYAAKTVAYMNLGVSPGMELWIQRAVEEGREIEYREIKDWTR